MWALVGAFLAGVVAGGGLVVAISPRAQKAVVHPVLAKLNERDDWHTKFVKDEERRVRRAARIR